jgi:flagellar motor switch protein FliM
MAGKEAVTQEELSSLLAALQVDGAGQPGAGGRDAEQIREARVHDFARSDTLPTPTIKALTDAYSTFARAAATTLSSHLRTAFEVSLLSVDQLTYDQCAGSVPDPTVAAVFTAAPLPGRALLEINPGIGFWLIDRMLGGGGDIVNTPRPLTDVEKALLQRSLSDVLGDLGTAWEGLSDIQPCLTEVLDSVAAAEIAKPVDPVSVASFEVMIGSLVAMASVCVPVISLKLGGVAALSLGDLEDGAGERESSATPGCLTEALSDVPVSCVVRLGGATARAGELLALEEGDVVCLDRLYGEHLELFVGDAPRFQCRPVMSHGKLAVEILGDAF